VQLTLLRRLRRDDRGLTLPELLIAIVILGVIIGPLTAALIVYVLNSDRTMARLSESNDVQIVSAYFAQDVQSTGIRSAVAPFTPAISMLTTWTVATPCDGRRPPTGTALPTTPILRLLWDEPGSPAVRVQVSYVVTDVTPGNERQLRRIECRGSPPANPAEVVVARNLDQTVTRPQAAVVSCAPAAACNITPVPRSVTLTLKLRHPTSGASTDVTLTGQRRQA
jgi:prepilin-type N-terminal cleavage/methylation domain-containing protein